ncbi:MAG: hypothetical protein EBV15_00975 [Bacteroidetes bacterium]|jgi:hypothetical protein|nr:hypothetical protein [Bacteroidota bacterium]
MKNTISLIGISSLLLSSCAFVLTGTKQRIRIVTTEPGAQVWHKNQLLDSTPCIVRIKRSFDTPPPIELRKQGFETQSLPLKRKFNETAALNFLLPVNWLVDGFSEAVVGYKAFDTIAMKPIAK